MYIKLWKMRKIKYVHYFTSGLREKSHKVVQSGK